MNDPLVPKPGNASQPASRTAAENIAEALRHLRLAMACLDAADEVTAPPHVQMAIEMLAGTEQAERPAEPGAFRF